MESTPGEGTTFRTLFPRDATQDNDDSCIAIPLRHGAERILFVDDEDVVLAVETRLLSNFGYHVATARSASEALEVLLRNQGKFDLVITDQNMQGMTDNS